MFENYYDKILLYIKEHPGCGTVSIKLNTTISNAIIILPLMN